MERERETAQAHVGEISRTRFSFFFFARFEFYVMKSVTLHRDKREKSMYEDFADLYAIIKTTEKLER